MAVTKSIRDGALFLIGDVGACSVSSHYLRSNIYQNGVWYCFFAQGSSPAFYIKRAISGTLLDYNSTSSTTVISTLSVQSSNPCAYRVGDSEWYMFIEMGGDIRISKSTNLGVTWTTPVTCAAHGTSWCPNTVTSPSVITSGLYFYLYVVGDTDKVGAFRCLTSADPLDDANWEECAANPLYDSQYNVINGRVGIDASGRIVWWGVMYEQSGGHADNVWAFETAGPGLALERRRIVGTFDYGVTVNTLYPGGVMFNTQDGYWYYSAYVSGQGMFYWVSETLGGAMTRVPSVSPAYWPEGAGIGLQFPKGGLRWSAKNAFKVVRDRGALSHLRRDEGGLSGDYTFAYGGDLGDVHDLIEVDTKRSLGDVKTAALLLCERDHDGAWGEYHLIPEAVIDLSFAEGDDSSEVTLSFTSPLPRPLVGLLNAGSVGSDMRAPGGATPQDYES